ncbi:MAG: site-specific DNA-methyltransferase [Deltaproteobacteria bacterium]|nr:site-specific DNA-methyltransferase [Deltaproteobacteria bacterium]
MFPPRGLPAVGDLPCHLGHARIGFGALHRRIVEPWRSTAYSRSTCRTSEDALSTVFPDLSSLSPPPSERWRVALRHGVPGGSNRLFHGDNLAALAWLAEHEPASFQCVYIDPPYNRGTKHAHYADARSRSAWLEFMARRLVLLRRLLRASGSLFVQLDDNELDYMKVVLDELFGTECFIGRVTVRARSPSAFSTVNRGVFKASEYLLWYARSRADFRYHPQRVPRPPDPAYTRWIENPQDPAEQWQLGRVRDAFIRERGPLTSRFRRSDPAYQQFVVDHAQHVFRLAPISDRKAGAGTVAAKVRSRQPPASVLVHHRSGGLEPVYILNGQQICRYDRNVTVIDGVHTASRPLTNIWTDIPWEGIAGEGGARFKQGKKPEKLIRRVLSLTTKPGDAVLDAFGGSGTTAAVAHKMGRAWVLLEHGPQARTIAEPRLRRVVDGLDDTGVSTVEDWHGGGGYAVLTPEAESPA